MTWQRRDVAITLALIAVYLLGAVALAVAVDRRFFVNDAIAIVIWLLFGAALLASGARSTRSRDGR